MKKKSKKVEIIYQYMLGRIHSDNMHVGMQLPTEHEISEQFHISRPTINIALNLLEKEGYIDREQGVGTFIKKKRMYTHNEKKKFIGLLFPLIGRGEIFNPIAEEIFRLSEQYNFNILWGGQFSPSDSSALQMNQMLDFYLSSAISGLIMAPIELSRECFNINRKTMERIKNANIPTVLVDGDYLAFPERSDYDLIGIDNYRVGYMMTKHFISQGAKRVDYCSYAYSAQTVFMRIKGYEQALLDAHIVPSEEWIHSGDPSNNSFVQSLLDKGASNFVCSNDSVAFELIKSVNSLHYKVPEQVRVAGVDDVNFSHYSSVPLTTIAQPCKEMAKIIIETVISRIENPILPTRTITLNAMLKIRTSSKLHQ